MKNFQSRNSAIHIISRGLLVSGEKVVLCRVKNKNWFFLPGGHVENGESSKTALIRELKEEIGENKYNVNSFIGVCENVFPLEEGIYQHEINLVFEVNIEDISLVSSKEEHLEFVAIEKSELQNYKILPDTLKEGLLLWLEKNKVFFNEI